MYKFMIERFSCANYYLPTVVDPGTSPENRRGVKRKLFTHDASGKDL